jgi:membrane-associated HD superfamily phosphohydrolase
MIFAMSGYHHRSFFLQQCFFSALCLILLLLVTGLAYENFPITFLLLTLVGFGLAMLIVARVPNIESPEANIF